MIIKIKMSIVILNIWLNDAWKLKVDAAPACSFHTQVKSHSH